MNTDAKLKHMSQRLSCCNFIVVCNSILNGLCIHNKHVMFILETVNCSLYTSPQTTRMFLRLSQTIFFSHDSSQILKLLLVY